MSHTIRRLLLLSIISSAHLAFGQTTQIAVWGNNGYGEAWVPTGLPSVKTAIIEANSGLALLQNGRLVTWGSNANGQTNFPASATNVVAIARSTTHSLALLTNGTAIAWGVNLNPPNGPAATSLSGNYGISAIAAGSGFTMLLQSGQVKQLPQSFVGPFGFFNAPFGLSSIKQISAGEYVAVALRSNGTVVVWGDPACTNIPAGLSDIKAIEAGNNHVTALRSNGTVVAWGRNYWHQTNVPSGLSNVVQIAAGNYHNLALREDGSLVSWGDGVSGEHEVPTGLTNIVGIAARGMTSVALVEDGPLCISKQPKGRSVFPGYSIKLGCSATGTSPLSFQWLREGTNLVGETNSTLSLANFSAAQAGNYAVLISNPATNLLSDVVQLDLGTVAGWGANWGEQLEPPTSLTNLSAISAGGGFSFALNRDGTVATWGQNPFGEHPAVSNVTAIAAGSVHALFLHTNGTVSGWGENLFGETQPPVNLTNAIAVSAGSSFSVALKQNKTVVAWGINDSGKTNVPSGLSNVTAIVCGYDHTLALKSDGKVIAWGNPSSGKTNVPANLSNVVSVAAGLFSSLALKNDGTLQVWGGALVVPPGLSNVVAISGISVFNAVALRSDGSIVAFGNDNSVGQNNVPVGVTNVACISSGWGYNLALVGDGSPAFPTPLSERSVHLEETLQLPALAAGAQPMTFQWQFNGQNIPGQTNSMLSISNVSPSAAGDYRVIASNSVGVRTNASTLVTTIRNPLRFATSADSLFSSNGMINLRVTGLAGSGPLVLFASTNFTTWQSILTNPPVFGYADFSIPAMDQPQFFRASEAE